MSRRWALALVGAVVIVALLLLIPGSPVRPGPMPRSTPEVVKRTIDRAPGLDVRWLDEHTDGDATIVAGVATLRGGRQIGFAVAISDANPGLERLTKWPAPLELRVNSELRRSRLPDGTWSLPVFRGIVGNASYANYLLDPDGGKPDEIRFPNNAEITAATVIDEALYSAFPQDDPEITAKSPVP